MLLGSLLRSIQTLSRRSSVSRDESDFEFSWNCHQCGLELVVFDVVCVRRMCLAGHNLV